MSPTASSSRTVSARSSARYGAAARLGVLTSHSTKRSFIRYSEYPMGTCRPSKENESTLTTGPSRYSSAMGASNPSAARSRQARAASSTFAAG